MRIMKDMELVIFLWSKNKGCIICSEFYRIDQIPLCVRNIHGFVILQTTFCGEDLSTLTTLFCLISEGYHPELFVSIVCY